MVIKFAKNGAHGAWPFLESIKRTIRFKRVAECPGNCLQKRGNCAQSDDDTCMSGAYAIGRVSERQDLKGLSLIGRITRGTRRDHLQTAQFGGIQSYISCLGVVIIKTCPLKGQIGDQGTSKAKILGKVVGVPRLDCHK